MPRDRHTTTGPATLNVRVIPRAGRTAVAGLRGEALLVKLTAAPADGAANEALVALLAETFGRPRRDIAIVSGHTARNKRIAVMGLTQEELDRRLSALCQSPPI